MSYSKQGRDFELPSILIRVHKTLQGPSSKLGNYRQNPERERLDARQLSFSFGRDFIIDLFSDTAAILMRAERVWVNETNKLMLSANT